MPPSGDDKGALTRCQAKASARLLDFLASKTVSQINFCSLSISWSQVFYYSNRSWPRIPGYLLLYLFQVLRAKDILRSHTGWAMAWSLPKNFGFKLFALLFLALKETSLSSFIFSLLYWLWRPYTSHWYCRIYKEIKVFNNMFIAHSAKINKIKNKSKASSGISLITGCGASTD